MALVDEQSEEQQQLLIQKVKQRLYKIIIATDVLQRGIDLNVDCVINFSMPATVQDFVHRCGRTGRAGRQGAVLSLYYKD